MLPTKPLLHEAELKRGPRPYMGPIEPGEVFAWEPDLPYARELCVVTRLTGDYVWTKPIKGGKEVWNDISRFREAVVPTIFKRQL